MVQLTELIYRIARAADGTKTAEQIAAEVGREAGVELSSADVENLIDEQLRPVGIVTRPDGTDAAPRRVDPLLALRLRVTLLGPSAVRRLARFFVPLFFTPVMAALTAAFVVLEIWFFFFKGIDEGLRRTLEQPGVFLFVLALTILSAGLHEFGHAAAAAYGGAVPGEMGAGIYLVWPAFFTDVTDAYNLPRTGRLRVDVGGIYFNALFALGAAAAYLWTGFEPLLLVILTQQFQILQQLLPFIRLDGYYIVSDLAGVPDLFSRLPSILKSVLPWREPDEKTRELKPRVRVIVTVWVAVTVVLLVLNLGIIVTSLPMIFTDAYHTIGREIGAIAASGEPLGVAAGAVRIATSAIVPLGVSLILLRVLRRAGAASLKKSRGQRQQSGGRQRDRDRQAQIKATEDRGKRRRRSVLPPLEHQALLASMTEASGLECQRARIVLAAAAGYSDAEIARRLEVSPSTVRRWRMRFEERGLEGLVAARGKGPAVPLATERPPGASRLAALRRPRRREKAPEGSGRSDRRGRRGPRGPSHRKPSPRSQPRPGESAA